MNDVSFSYYQIMIVSLFLLALVLAHFYVKKNKGMLRTKLGTSKYMQVIEEISISQSERIRLIRIGSELIFLASSKGSSPVIQVLSGISYKRPSPGNVKGLKTGSATEKEIPKKGFITKNPSQKATTNSYGNALKTAIQQARKMNPHVSF